MQEQGKYIESIIYDRFHPVRLCALEARITLRSGFEMLLVGGITAAAFVIGTLLAGFARPLIAVVK